MRVSILAKVQDSAYIPGAEIELDYRRFEKKTVKYFVDALHECNAKPIPVAELLKLVQLVSKMGFAENEEGKFWTLNELVGCLNVYIWNKSLGKRMDVGFCLTHFQEEVIQELMNECFEGATAEKVRDRAFRYLYSGADSELVHEIVKLALRDSGMDGTDAEVRAQIRERTLPGAGSQETTSELTRLSAQHFR